MTKSGTVVDATKKCHYCDNAATKMLVWLYDKNKRAARIKLPWCGCDLMVALRRIWGNPYQVHEGRDYEVLPIDDASREGKPCG